MSFTAVPFEKQNFKQYLNEHKKNISKMLTRLSLI